MKLQSIHSISTSDRWTCCWSGRINGVKGKGLYRLRFGRWSSKLGGQINGVFFTKRNVWALRRDKKEMAIITRWSSAVLNPSRFVVYGIAEY